MSLLKKRIEQLEKSYKAPKSYLDSLSLHGALKEIDAQLFYMLDEVFDGELRVANPELYEEGRKSIEREEAFNKRHGIVPKKQDIPEDFSELIKGL